jgi:hypothetical protein
MEVGRMARCLGGLVQDGRVLSAARGTGSRRARITNQQTRAISKLLARHIVGLSIVGRSYLLVQPVRGRVEVTQREEVWGRPLVE